MRSALTVTTVPSSAPRPPRRPTQWDSQGASPIHSGVRARASFSIHPWIELTQCQLPPSRSTVPARLGIVIDATSRGDWGRHARRGSVRGASRGAVIGTLIPWRVIAGRFHLPALSPGSPGFGSASAITDRCGRIWGIRFGFGGRRWQRRRPSTHRELRESRLESRWRNFRIAMISLRPIRRENRMIRTRFPTRTAIDRCRTT